MDTIKVERSVMEVKNGLLTFGNDLDILRAILRLMCAALLRQVNYL